MYARIVGLGDVGAVIRVRKMAGGGYWGRPEGREDLAARRCLIGWQGGGRGVEGRN